MYYRTATLQPYVAVSMTSLSSQIDHWAANIPAQPVGTIIYYYVEGESNSGKQQVRPISAPAGYWKFEVLGPTGLGEDLTTFELQSVFPNPSKGITCIPLISNEKQKINIRLIDVLGKQVETIFDGFTAVGENRYFLNTEEVPAGLYFIEVNTSSGSKREKLVVR